MNHDLAIPTINNRLMLIVLFPSNPAIDEICLNSQHFTMSICQGVEVFFAQLVQIWADVHLTLLVTNWCALFEIRIEARSLLAVCI